MPAVTGNIDLGTAEPDTGHTSPYDAKMVSLRSLAHWKQTSDAPP